MGTAGCEPQQGPAEHVTAAGKVLTEALWGQIEITTDELCWWSWRWQWYFALTVLVVVEKIALHCLSTVDDHHSLLSILLSQLQTSLANRASICDTPRVWDMIQTDSTVDLTLCRIQPHWEWDLSEHVWLTHFSSVHWHRFVSAVGEQAWVSVSWLLAGVLGTSYSLCGEEINASVLIRGPSDRNQSGFCNHKATTFKHNRCLYC